jgi:hypothetical protein
MHLMTNGQPCGRPDGHTGQHRSVQGLEHNREYSREWRARNLGHSRKYDRERSALNPERREYNREYYREWYERNRERRREYMRKYMREYYLRRKQQQITPAPALANSPGTVRD